MLALAELRPEELRALCTDTNRLPHNSVPVRMSEANYAPFRQLHVIAGQLIGVSPTRPSVAKLIEDAYSQ